MTLPLVGVDIESQVHQASGRGRGMAQGVHEPVSIHTGPEGVNLNTRKAFFAST